MCIALPAQVVELLDGQRALVRVQGTRREVSLELLDGVAPGDHVMVHLGRALYVVDAAEAALSQALFDELAAALAAQGP